MLPTTSGRLRLQEEGQASASARATPFSLGGLWKRTASAVKPEIDVNVEGENVSQYSGYSPITPSASGTFEPAQLSPRAVEGFTSFIRNLNQKRLDIQPSRTVLNVGDLSSDWYGLPEPVGLEFKDLTMTLKVGRGKRSFKKPMLRHLNGFFPPGILVAIMGPKGSGALALLEALAGKVEQGMEVRGEVLINGQSQSQRLKQYAAFIHQMDVLFPVLTVQETLVFSARLRLPYEMPWSAKSDLVERIISELGLRKVATMQIGTPDEGGITRGERKLVSLGVELVTNPSVIFLDEPTTGLDSLSSLHIMTAMRDLARSGRTVVATLHAPRSKIFKQLQHLILMSEGQMVYFGMADQARAHFEKLGFPCPADYNPADFLLDLVSTDTRNEKVVQENRQRVKRLIDGYTDPELSTSGPTPSSPPQSEDSLPAWRRRKYAVGYFTQLFLLTQRAFRQVWRDPWSQLRAVFEATLVGVVVGSLFWKSRWGGASVLARTSALFFATFYVAVHGSLQVLHVFENERVLVWRERDARAYKASVYYTAKVTCELPRLLAPIVYSTLLYVLVGLTLSWKYYSIFLVAIIGEFFSANAVGFLVGAYFANPNTAYSAMLVINGLFVVFGGFFVPIAEIPNWLGWLAFFSPVFWANVIVQVNEWRDRPLKCHLLNSELCPTDGNAVLRWYDFDKLQIPTAIAAQTIFSYLINVAALLVLITKRPRYKKVEGYTRQVT